MYSIKFEPDVPDTSRKVRSEILKPHRDKIITAIGHYIFIGTAIFS